MKTKEMVSYIKSPLTNEDKRDGVMEIKSPLAYGRHFMSHAIYNTFYMHCGKKDCPHLSLTENCTQSSLDQPIDCRVFNNTPGPLNVTYYTTIWSSSGCLI